MFDQLAAYEPGVIHWAAFGVLVALLLAIDLFVFHRKDHEPSLAESAGWTCVWIGIALAFNAFVWAWRGQEQAALFLTGYLVEKSLSIDNVFVFAVIFNFFRVPLKYQYRVLFWGVAGAVVARLVFIFAGATLLEQFAWMSVVFGLILIYTAIKLIAAGESEIDPDRNILMRAARRIFRVAELEHGSHFVAVEFGKWCITPLFLVLLVVESTDVLFAVDSVPAVLSITTDKFTVFTSNIFAILGLRALYFLLAGVMDLFRFLNYGLSGVLAFLGSKMVYEFAVGHELASPLASLGVIAGLLGAAVLVSVACPAEAGAADRS